MKNSARRIGRPGRESASVRPAGVLAFSLHLSFAPISHVAPALGRAALIALLIFFLGIPANSDQAGSAFKRGQKAENHNDYDAAFQEYGTAHRLKPDDARYLISYLRARNTAAQNHLENGQMLRSQGKFQDAINEFKHATDIDDTNAAARQEMDVTSEMLRKETERAAGIKIESSLAMKAAETQGPVELEPISNAPLTLRMTTTTDNVYKTIGKLAGINVLLDMDYKPQRISIELDEVPLLEALRMVALESKTYWRPISSKAIFVTSEARRKEYEDNVMTTFYIHNAGTAAELQEIVATLKSMLDLTRIQVNPTHSTITVRGTSDQMILAQKLISDLDRPKAEVVIDIMVLEVSRDRIRDLGTSLPTTASIGLLPPSSSASGSSSSGSSSSTPSFNFGRIGGTQWTVGYPTGSFTFLMTDSRTKVLQNPEVRVLDQGKASLKIGNRVPIATGSTSSGSVAGAGINPLFNTQFQYLDVGMNMDVTPHVLSDHQIDLKMTLEVSTVTGEQNIGGFNQPTIGQRHLEHEMRIRDGEINLVGGFLSDNETIGLGGYPWIGELPLLKYLLGNENREHSRSEIVFAILPHIVRTDDATAENLRLIDIGTVNSIDLRRGDQVKRPPAAPAPSSSLAKP